jgi:DNA-binding XRE family transcriptional regulator
MTRPDIQKMKNDFEVLQQWVRERIQFYTRNHRPPYSQAALAKEIGVSSKTVLFGLELSENMSYRKWMELAEGIITKENGK